MPPEPVQRRVILHFGPPKTGTSALQAWCYANGAVLERYGVRYASVDAPDDPKHQWLLGEFRKARFDRLRAEREAFPGHDLILSCEGVLAHRAAFPAEAWPKFRAALAGADTHLFLVQRDPDDWKRSLWKQGVLNSPVSGRIPVPSLARFATAPWLAEMIALPELARRLAQDCGAGEASLARYEGDWLAAFRSVAGLPDDPAFVPPVLVNASAPGALIQLYLALALVETDVSELRLDLFAIWVRLWPTTNLTLRSVARRFAAQERNVRVRQLRHLEGRLSSLRAEDPALVTQLASAVAAWCADLSPDQS